MSLQRQLHAPPGAAALDGREVDLLGFPAVLDSGAGRLLAADSGDEVRRLAAEPCVGGVLGGIGMALLLAAGLRDHDHALTFALPPRLPDDAVGAEHVHTA